MVRNGPKLSLHNQNTSEKEHEMKKLFKQNSFVTFFDTLCTHLKRNISDETIMEYEIAPILFTKEFINGDILSHIFLDFISLIRAELQSGVIKFFFSGELNQENALSLVVDCNIRDCSIRDLGAIRDRLENISELLLLTCNDLDIKFKVSPVAISIDEGVNRIIQDVKSRKVLLVGGSSVLRKYKDSLDGFALNSSHVKTGGEAFELLFNDAAYDLVIMDESNVGIVPDTFKSLLQKNSLLSHIHLLSILDFEGLTYGPFLEKVVQYLEGVVVSESVEIEDKNETSIFDHNTLYERTGGNSVFIRKIIALYCKDMEKYLQTLSEVDNHEDTVTSQRIAHAMKGASFSCCAERMAFHASELETAYKKGGVDGVPLLLDSLRVAFRDFQAEVTSIGYLP